jgi:hypothetical protein
MIWYTREPGVGGAIFTAHRSKTAAGWHLLVVGGAGIDLGKFGLYRTNPQKDPHAENVLPFEALKAAKRKT